jgi:predicted flap endonuclease-1-like 5' DNA nuclease
MFIGKESTMKIVDIEGIGPAYAAKLNGIGIRTTDALLDKGCSPEDRKQLAEATGVGENLLLEWVNLADLFRIKGVGSEYSDLLEEAGVDTVVELATRVPGNLLETMIQVNKEKNLVNKMPGLNQVKAWVAQAKKLPRVITY